MSDAGIAATSQSPLWRFSVKFYATPGVADACIALQDQAGADVNVLLFLLWNASQGRTLSEDEITDIERAIGPWRAMAVVPIRDVRRALKAPPSAVEARQAEALRTRIKAVELEAERLQQDALFAMAGRLGRPAASPAQAARASVAAYQAALRPLPAGPLGIVLSAFAKFDPPR